MGNYEQAFTALVASICSNQSSSPPDADSKEGVILASGYNFGTGSSREQAATALKAAGIPLVTLHRISRPPIARFIRRAAPNSSSPSPIVARPLPTSPPPLQSFCASLNSYNGQRPERYRTTPSNEKGLVGTSQLEYLDRIHLCDKKTTGLSQNEDPQTQTFSLTMVFAEFI